jgi:NTE family protein
VSAGITAVLSGGGVKAAAHLGAVRALLEAGVVPTRYVGTSMGAVIATGFAAGLPAEEIARRLMLVRQRDIFAVDRTALIKGMFARALLKPEPFRRTLAELLPVTRFDQLITPVTVTATDLDTGAQIVFGAGGETIPLLDALCATCALPLFFPPFPVDGRRCADGGLREVVPLEVAARFPASLVVAVDVGPGFDMEPGESLRTPALLRLQGDAQWALMASNTRLAHALWDATPDRPPLLWIRPRARRGETFATEQLQWYIAEGERAAKATLAARET